MAGPFFDSEPVSVNHIISMADHSELDHALADGAVLMICGPTAAGKSGLALALAERCGGIIINAGNSMQLYGDLRVLTARPDDGEEARAPHRLYGVLDGAERASVASWLTMASREIETARQAGRVPILVGGTGLYFHAAMNGLAPVPDVPPEVHAACVAEYAERGGEAFRKDCLSWIPCLARSSMTVTASASCERWVFFAPPDGH